MARVEYECRRCGKIVSLEQYEKSQFCPDPECATRLQLKPQPKHWMFQFCPEQYRWFDRIKATRATEQWLATQNSKLMHKGDFVAIWCSGRKAGIYAVGQMTTNAAKRALDPNQEEYFVKKEMISKFLEKPSVFVEYATVYVENPILQAECSQDTTLSSLQVFTNPQRTNFWLTNDEWDRILELFALKLKSSSATS